MTTKRQTLGRRGERIAGHYLQKQGYTIVNRNWRSSNFEVDIVVIHGDQLVLIEVKTRTCFHEHPIHLITDKQLENLSEAAVRYLETHSLDFGYRIDLVGIEYDNAHTSICHRRDIY